MKAKIAEENGFRQTEIGSIPEDWEVKVIANVVEKAKQTDPTRTPDCSFRYVDVTSVSKDALKITEYKDYMGENAPGRARKSIQTEDVIFATVRPTLRRIAYIDELFNGEICSTAFCVLRSKKDKLFSRYLYYYVQTDEFVDELAKLQRGASYPAVTDSDIKNQRILLPSLNEQVNIAFVLSKIQQAIEQQDKIIEKTKELKRSLMQRLFTYGLWGEELKETEIGLMPESWEAKPFESLCENVKDSWNPGQYLNGIYVGLEHIESGNSVLKSFGTAQNLRSSKFIFSEGDILYGKLRPYLDKAVITNKKGICSTDILVFRPKNNVPAGFIVNLIHWSPFIEYAKKTTHGVNHPRTSWNSIRNFTCGIPQYEEQKEIASILSSIDEKIERERQREYQFRALFKSMLQLLMTGQVRVKDIDFGEDCE